MIKRIYIFTILILLLFTCDNENVLRKKISKINIDFNIERFDSVFANTPPENLSKIKSLYPFMFSKRFNDSIWIKRMTDTLQQQLFKEAENQFSSNKQQIYNEIKGLFQHLTYYDSSFKTPRIMTVLSDVDYYNKTIVTDTLVFISLDTYLGKNHHFYSDIPSYITQNLTPSQIVCDLASNYSRKHLLLSDRKSFIEEMIFYGKQLYFKDLVIPFKTDAEKIGYTEEQLVWSKNNESEIWRYFVHNELLFSTDKNLVRRFISPSPFSKFYLDSDSESPGRIGQYIGWQIVKAYMSKHDISINQLYNLDGHTLFNYALYKPKK